MKKKSVFCCFLLAILLLCSCAAHRNLEKLREACAQGQPVYNGYPVQTYCSDQVYSVVVLHNGEVVKGAEFTAHRVAAFAVNLKLIQVEDIQVYLGKSLSHVEKALGEYHVDTGSGQYMPSYITEDGYLIVFTVDWEDHVVEHVGKMDLLTGESVEWYFLSRMTGE